MFESKYGKYNTESSNAKKITKIMNKCPWDC